MPQLTAEITLHIFVVYVMTAHLLPLEVDKDTVCLLKRLLAGLMARSVVDVVCIISYVASMFLPAKLALCYRQ